LLYQLVEHRFESGKENSQLFGLGDRPLMVCKKIRVWNVWGSGAGTGCVLRGRGELAGISDVNWGSRRLSGSWVYWAMGFTSSLL
jgi:hypothetical protein